MADYVTANGLVLKLKVNFDAEMHCYDAFYDVQE
jgi:hypothetical protein